MQKPNRQISDESGQVVPLPHVENAGKQSFDSWPGPQHTRLNWQLKSGGHTVSPEKPHGCGGGTHKGPMQHWSIWHMSGPGQLVIPPQPVVVGTHFPPTHIVFGSGQPVVVQSGVEHTPPTHWLGGQAPPHGCMSGMHDPLSQCDPAGHPSTQDAVTH